MSTLKVAYCQAVNTSIIVDDTPVFEEGKAYIADENYGLQIVDVSDPTAPFIVGFADP